MLRGFGRAHVPIKHNRHDRVVREVPAPRRIQGSDAQRVPSQHLIDDLRRVKQRRRLLAKLIRVLQPYVTELREIDPGHFAACIRVDGYSEARSTI